MEAISFEKSPSNIKRRAALAVILLVALASAAWYWRTGSPVSKPKGGGAVQVTSAKVLQTDVPVRLTANGTVVALQTVDIRPQISATVNAVHVREGQFVHRGDRLFTLDARSEDANLNKARAQVVRDRADLANAERNLDRQRQLFKQEYISQAEFDLAQNQVDGFRSQLAVDEAVVESSLVARSYNEISAPISGRTGAISVYPGTLVQPNGNLTTNSLLTTGPVLVSITRMDPVNVSFTLPERELAAVLKAFAQGNVSVNARLDQAGQPALQGRLVFIDNAVDMASGAIRLKAEFPNKEQQLWPGMFVTVTLAPQVLQDVLTVPLQAVQTGPERKFVYVIGGQNKVKALPVNVHLIQDGIAVIEGIEPGMRVVVEGAQNLRPGSVVAEDRWQNAEYSEMKAGNGKLETANRK